MYKNGKPNYNEVVFTEEELNDIVDMYLNGMSSVKIGKKYNVGHKCILKALRKRNIKIDPTRFTRKYSIDESFFDIIDTEQKAYILGFLYSDGSINLSKGTIALSLQEEDKAILEQIRNELHSKKPLEYINNSNKHDFGYSYKNQYRLLVFNTHICKELENKGVIQNKSLKITFPNWLREDLIPHFVRGVYDGDGSIYRSIKSEKNHAIMVTITATENFCMSLRKICNETIGIDPKIYDASCHNGITKVFTISGRNIAKTFLDWIYEDATIYMERKYKRYLDYYNKDNSLTA